MLLKICYCFCCSGILVYNNVAFSLEAEYSMPTTSFLTKVLTLSLFCLLIIGFVAYESGALHDFLHEEECDANSTPYTVLAKQQGELPSVFPTTPTQEPIAQQAEAQTTQQVPSQTAQQTTKKTGRTSRKRKRDEQTLRLMYSSKSMITSEISILPISLPSKRSALLDTILKDTTQFTQKPQILTIIASPQATPQSTQQSSKQHNNSDTLSNKNSKGKNTSSYEQRRVYMRSSKSGVIIPPLQFDMKLPQGKKKKK